MEEKKYLDVYKKIKNKITEGELKKGEKLPSKRVTAEKENVSVITVEKAYGMLTDEGYITPKERSGYFVSDIEVLKDREEESEKSITYLSEETGEISEFEYSLWFKTVRKVISEKGELLFRKAPGRGCAVLRNSIASYLLRYRGIFTSPENIIIGSGAEQLYASAVKVLGRDKIYGIENPSYSQIEAVYKGEGVKIKKLKMGNDGIRSDELVKGGFDVLHVTPFKSFPSNVTTSAGKRYEYLSWASKKGVIIEDDFGSEFFAPGASRETLYSMNKGKNVLYINTFSKSLSPSMRIGYMILPDSLSDKYEKQLGAFSCPVPVLDQYVLSEFIDSGSFERHVNRMRRKINKDLTK
ncbi:MAG: PLP-dependent aminotransferase family protein [Clostridia bacterium]|nr:PLP-dependent aminotransferase family protein [Clostridia bacterium]